MKHIYIASILFFGLLFGALHVSAHSTGVSLEKTIDEYRVDIGQNPPVLETENPAVFDFDLVFEKTGERAEFSDIWVRIVQGKKTVFASGINKPDFGNTTMVYTFPQGGEYELNVRFQKAGEKIVEASFPLAIEGVTTDSGFNLPLLLLGFFIGTICGFLVSFILLKKKT
ncbi:MAG: hypothetical protein O3C23_00640 [bacterium]|nr:hypothetical protein [bacterium]